MQLTLSKLGFRGTWLPWRNVRSRLYDGAWERWRIVCLAALSVEDIDIYLFGTMITGILLIRLGFTLGYRRIQKTGTAVQSPTRLPVWLKLWEEQYGFYQGEVHGFTKGNWLKWDQNGQNGQRVACKNWNVYSPQRQNNLIFFWLPYSGLGKAVAAIYPGCAMQLDALAFLPHPTQTLQTLPPPRPFASVRFDPLAWSSGSDQRRISGCGIRWLLAGPDSLPLWLCRVCAFVAEVFFLFSHCTPQGA